MTLIIKKVKISHLKIKQKENSFPHKKEKKQIKLKAAGFNTLRFRKSKPDKQPEVHPIKKKKKSCL